MTDCLKVYKEQDILPYTTYREGESRFFNELTLLKSELNIAQALKDAAQFGIKYALICINEDIGPRANCGNGGATNGWHAFLKRFLNLPCNEFLSPNNVLLLGEVLCTDIQQRSQNLDNKNPDELQQLRQLCSELDERVYSVLKLIFAADIEPIVIGGGHNNCYGILKALSHVSNKPCQAINFDPHADFRPLEGRHSGNGFNYAYQEEYLADYHVVGMHEQKNNQAIIDGLHSANFTYSSYQDILVKRKLTIKQACNIAFERFDPSLATGIEVDVDSISGMPVSAFTNCGFSVNDAEHFVHLGANQKNSRYLHLCEAAPDNHPQGQAQGIIEAGQVLSGLVCSYLSAK